MDAINKTANNQSMISTETIQRHIFTGIHFFLAILAFVVAVWIIIKRKVISQSRHLVVMLGCVVMINITRALVHQVRQWNLVADIGVILWIVLTDIAASCSASVVYILLVILIRVTKMELVCKSVLSSAAICVIMAINTVVVVSAAVIAHNVKQTDLVLNLCTTYSILFNTTCCVAFLVLIIKFCKLLKNCEIVHRESTAFSQSGTQTPTKFPLILKIVSVLFFVFLLDIFRKLYKIMHMTFLAKYLGDNQWVELAIGLFDVGTGMAKDGIRNHELVQTLEFLT
ncbi:hypothetical protein CAPTEDRAFT_204109 [Capitella teleta]|uniref:Uncharacterized protein n=1 Tax=Capitella teleta TaxID=283909 RepID=R7UN33_CAPTE|nr:hypothetical protein CAPTEDRAFT_204109 [Capitella teleta]|eukprot:ELU07498.1 hypothetical protein CAPTEDRAFT_204109 [Capitella teleta]